MESRVRRRDMLRLREPERGRGAALPLGGGAGDEVEEKEDERMAVLATREASWR